MKGHKLLYDYVEHHYWHVYLPVVQGHRLDHLVALKGTREPEILVGVSEVFRPQGHPEDVDVAERVVRRKSGLPTPGGHFGVSRSGH